MGISYYFRGDVQNNYVSFAGYIWRIIRINGDGSIRMILSDSIGSSTYNENYLDNAYAGYMYGDESAESYDSTHANKHDSDVKMVLDEWYIGNLESYSDYIEDAIYCNDRKVVKNNSFVLGSTIVFDGDGIGTSSRPFVVE